MLAGMEAQGFERRRLGCGHGGLETMRFLDIRTAVRFAINGVRLLAVAARSSGQAGLNPAIAIPGRRIIDRHGRQFDNRHAADMRPDRTHFAVAANIHDR
jgi:hypothetical protein